MGFPVPKRTSEEISFDDRNDRRWQSNVMRKSDRIPRYASFYQRYQGKGPGEFRSLKVGFRENLQSVCRHSNDTGILVGEFFPNCLESRPMFILPPSAIAALPFEGCPNVEGGQPFDGLRVRMEFEGDGG